MKHGVPHPQSLSKTIEKNFIPEGDLYRLLTHSELPSAESFEQWVFDEVLPEIRKTGKYEIEKAFDVPQTFAQALRLAAEQAELIEAQTKQLEEQKPKVDFADKLLKSKDSILIREFAKIMWEEGVCQFGEKKMFAWLRNNGYLMKGNEPYQKYIHLFEVQERPIDTAFGVKITTTTKITPHGQLYFYNKLKELESNFQITYNLQGGNI